MTVSINNNNVIYNPVSLNDNATTTTTGMLTDKTVRKVSFDFGSMLNDVLGGFGISQNMYPISIDHKHTAEASPSYIDRLFSYGPHVTIARRNAAAALYEEILGAIEGRVQNEQNSYVSNHVPLPYDQFS
ncbi:MAG: hypothetical protein H0W88_12780 [Parachlamydiaceae bacterium]|nr:hypothetical protein [Parachlamydiaceae bacterium]